MNSCANIVNRLQSDVCLIKENWNSIELMDDNIKIDQAIFNQSPLLVYLIPTTTNGIGIPLTIEASYSSSLTTTIYSGLIVLDPSGSENCVVFTTQTLINFGQRTSTGFFEMTDTLPIVVIDADPSILSTLTYNDVVSALQSCASANDNHTVSCEAYNALLIFLKNNFGIQNLTPSVAACFYENRSLKAASVVLPPVEEESKTNVSVVLPPVDKILNNNSVIVSKIIEEKEQLIIEKAYPFEPFEPFEPVCLWEQKGESLTGNNNLGYSISLSSDGNIVAIGGIGNNGIVKVYEWNGTSWTQKGSTFIGDSNSDNFGYSISLSSDGNILAVGAWGYNTNSGYVKVYEWNSTLWTQKGSTFIGDTSSRTGWCVSLSSDGEILAIGAPAYNSFKGSIHIYQWSNTLWIQKGNTFIGESNSDGLGNSVSLSSDGNIVAIGISNFNFSKGQVNIYEWSGLVWIQKGNSLNGVNFNDNFGSSLSLSSNGTILAISAESYNNYTGIVNVYEFNSASWTQKGNSLNGDNLFDRFGSSVFLSSDGLILAVGAYNNDGGRGKVNVYQWNGLSWIQKGESLYGETINDNFGKSVSLSSYGLILAVGASFVNNSQGQAKVYNYDCITREIYSIKPAVLRIEDSATTTSDSNTESSSNDAIEAKLRALLEVTETSEVSRTE
jgi:hypothetical protein